MKSIVSPANETELDNYLNQDEKVYKQIKELMFRYEIIPGQKLQLQDLADKFGVSRVPVKNALSMLAHEGFVDYTLNRGYKVKEISYREALELYEIRILIEKSAVEIAVSKGYTPEQQEELQKRMEAYNRAIEEEVTRKRFILDQNFHQWIVRMGGNLQMSRYFEQIYQLIFLKHRIEGLSNKRAKMVKVEHQKIFDAISERNSAEAARAVVDHIQNGASHILSVVS